MMCERQLCLTHCGETPPCLCKGHANPRSDLNWRADKIVAQQIKEKKLHRKADGKVYPGPAPASSKSSPGSSKGKKGLAIDLPTKKPRK